VAVSGSLVQVAAPSNLGSVTSELGTFGLPITAGNLIVVTATWDNQSATASVADTKGNTYTSAVGPTNWSTANRAQIFFAKNIGGQSANAVTVTFSVATTSFAEIRLFEYSGQDTTSPLDVTSSATGTSTALNSGSATTNFANELVFGTGDSSTGTLSPGAGFTAREGNNSRGLQEDQSITSIGLQSATETNSVSAAWVMLMATFKNASQPGGGAPNLLPLVGMGAAL